MLRQFASLGAFALLSFACWSVSLAADAKPDPLDWPHWRGPEMNGISRETGLVERWSPDGENLLWLNKELSGRSTPIVMRGKLYLQQRHLPATLQESEKVICVNAETGEKLWENVFNVFLSDVPDTRVGWPSVVGDPETGRIFVMGVCGFFQCLDGETGKTIWSRSLSEEFGILTTYGGRTNFPTVFENLVIISGVNTAWGETARPAHRFFAFDKRNGQLVWTQSTRPLPEDTTYSSPIIATIGGQTQLIFGAGDGSIRGWQIRTGKPIWEYYVSPRGINVSPVQIDSSSRIVAAHSEENLDDTRVGAFFSIDANKQGDITKTGEFWRNREQAIGKVSPLVVNGRAYGIDDGGTMFIVDAQTGEFLKDAPKKKVKIGTLGRGSPVFGDGKIYACDGTGRFFIFQPTETGVKVLHQVNLSSETNASPIISHGKIYLTTEDGTFCIGNKETVPAAKPRPSQAEEPAVTIDLVPAQAVMIPAESLMKPGEKLEFQVLLYNARGQYLKVASNKDVKFTVVGVGGVDADAIYRVPQNAPHATAIVTAELEGLKATSRIRVSPGLPWKIDFADGKLPPTGIGMGYRHVPLSFTLREKLRQENPLAAKLYIAMQTQFTNFNPQVAKFDDTTVQQTWTNLRRYLGILETVTTQGKAKEVLDPLFEILKREEIVAEWSWSGDEKIGAQLNVKRGPRKIDGEGVMCKITTIPKGTRSQGWFGHTTHSSYVIQADALGAAAETTGGDKNSKMPDIGLINQRYRFEMMGAHQQLKLYSWYPHDQKYFAVPFPWEPETWYTLKFQVTVKKNANGKEEALLQGKAWKRSDPEPEKWSIEWTDGPPNFTGSPGLAGSSKDAEIFFDNVLVTPRAD